MGVNSHRTQSGDQGGWSMTGGSARKLRFIQEIRNQLDIWMVSEDSKSLGEKFECVFSIDVNFKKWRNSGRQPIVNS